MRRRTAAGLLAGVALVAAGCGSSGNGVASKSPTDILQTALAAMKSAQSVTIDGTITSGSDVVTVDAAILSNGDFDGTIGENGKSAKLVKVGATDYLNGDLAFWTGNGLASAEASKVASRWVAIPDSQMGFGKTFSLDSLANSFQQNAGKISAGTTGTVDGQAAVSIVSSQGGTLWVATTGTAYPIQLSSTKKGDAGNISFSGWNQASTPGVPAGAETITQLVGGAGSSGGQGTTGSGTTGSGTTGSGATGSGATG